MAPAMRQRWTASVERRDGRQAKSIFSQLPRYKDEPPPEFSPGWIHRFKKRYGLLISPPATPRRRTQPRRRHVLSRRYRTPLHGRRQRHLTDCHQGRRAAHRRRRSDPGHLRARAGRDCPQDGEPSARPGSRTRIPRCTTRTIPRSSSRTPSVSCSRRRPTPKPRRQAYDDDPHDEDRTLPRWGPLPARHTSKPPGLSWRRPLSTARVEARPPAPRTGATSLRALLGLPLST